MTPELIHVGQIAIRFLLTSADTHGALAMFEFTVPVGARVPVPHSHRDYDETIYGVAGVLTFTVEGRRVDLAPGDCCFIPRGAVHGFDNHQSTDARCLAVVTPALLGPDFFRDIAAILNLPGPPDVAKLNAAMLRHGLIPSPPPLAG